MLFAAPEMQVLICVRWFVEPSATLQFVTVQLPEGIPRRINPALPVIDRHEVGMLRGPKCGCKTSIAQRHQICLSRIEPVFSLRAAVLRPRLNTGFLMQKFPGSPRSGFAQR